jgi:hypothetical protein
LNRVLTLALALLVLAIFQAAVAALVVPIAIMLLFYLATRPWETLIFLGTLLVFGLASARPVAFIVMAGIVGLAVVVMGNHRRPARKR